MAKRWCATSLVALALLGCLVGTNVEAQDPIWQMSAPQMSKGSAPPQAPQVLPRPPPPKAPQYPQPPQVQLLSPPKAHPYPQMPQVQPPPLQRVPQHSQIPQVQDPPPQRVSQHSQVPQVQPLPLQRVPQHSQIPQVQDPPPQRVSQHSQVPQVQPLPLQRVPQHSQIPQVQDPPPQRVSQHSQVPQVQPPPLQRVPQHSQIPQVQSPPPQRVPQYSPTSQVQLPSSQSFPHYSQKPQVQPPPLQRVPQYSPTSQVQLPPPQRVPQYSPTSQVQLPPPQRVPQYSPTSQVQPSPPKKTQYDRAPQILPSWAQFPQYSPPPKAPQYPQLSKVQPLEQKLPHYSQTPQIQAPPAPQVPKYTQVPKVLPPASSRFSQYPQASKFPQVYPRTFPDFKSPEELQAPQPHQPYQPEQTHESHQPYQPQQPHEPHQPYQPNQPHQPHQPLQPYQPHQPLQPYQPQQPYQPHQPLQPHQPHQPLQPHQPHQPLQPHQPHQPTSPQELSIYQPSAPKQPSFQTCEVADSQRVQCGPSDISAAACEGISCCFDGRQCYFGKAVTVQCTKDAQFIVVVARDATLPNLDLESISLLGQGQHCSHVDSNSEFAIYQFHVTDCGSVVMEEPGVIIYENSMSSSYEVGVGPLGAITRDSSYDVRFQCRYTGTSVETVVVDVLDVQEPLLPVAALGPIRVHLRLANGQCNAKGCNEADVAYSSFYMEADYPVSKVLRDPVYVEVQLLERTDPNLVLTLGRCWTTTSPNPHSLPQWDILIDGCPYRDDRYLSTLLPVGPSSGLDFPSHYRRFIFKMFTFVDPNSMEPLKEQVYIHCSTAVCSAELGRSCEPSCFRKKRDVKAVDQKTSEPKVVVSVGPVIMSASEP